jgi:hypothetical protein
MEISSHMMTRALIMVAVKEDRGFKPQTEVDLEAGMGSHAIIQH